MNASDNPIRPSYWRETLLAMKSTLRHEWHLVLGFAVFMGVAQFLILRHFDMNAFAARFEKDPIALAGDTEAMRQIMAHAGRDFVVQGVLGFLASYIFTNLYLRREAISSPPPLNFGNFIYWFGRVCQKYSILFLPLFLLELFAVVPVLPQYSAEQTNMIILGFMVVWGIYYLFFSLRLSLVTPMAILRREPVMKSSWTMTNNKCWPIFLSAVILRIVLLPVFLAPNEAGNVCADMWGNLSISAHAFWAMAQGLWSSLMSMAGAVYYCTVYRILLQEQRNSRILGGQ